MIVVEVVVICSVTVGFSSIMCMMKSSCCDNDTNKNNTNINNTEINAVQTVNDTESARFPSICGSIRKHLKL